MKYYGMYIPHKMYRIDKIISGGQTGADRAGLDFAIKNKIPHGGWIPKGRLTENGKLSAKYHLKEMSTSSYPARTQKNVIVADGTLIVSKGSLSGGSALTREFAKRSGKPWLHINMKNMSRKDASEKLISWLTKNRIKVLNVAGPRDSKDSGIYKTVLSLLQTSVSK
jgi:hypothetical protein